MSGVGGRLLKNPVSVILVILAIGAFSQPSFSKKTELGDCEIALLENETDFQFSPGQPRPGDAPTIDALEAYLVSYGEKQSAPEKLILYFEDLKRGQSQMIARSLTEVGIHFISVPSRVKGNFSVTITSPSEDPVTQSLIFALTPFKNSLSDYSTGVDDELEALDDNEVLTSPQWYFDLMALQSDGRIKRWPKGQKIILHFLSPEPSSLSSQVALGNALAFKRFIENRITDRGLDRAMGDKWIEPKIEIYVDTESVDDLSDVSMAEVSVTFFDEYLAVAVMDAFYHIRDLKVPYEYLGIENLGKNKPAKVIRIGK